MAECNKQAVEDVKRNIESQIASLQKEIDSMNQTISRLSSCNGTKENPHNHSSEIGSLRSQISANQSTIEQLFSLLKAVMDAKTTMEEADRKLRELVEAYQQGKTERMKLTSAILYDEMKILEEEYKAGIINSYEYEGTLVHLKEQYIETLQSEIDMHKERIKHISGSSSEYDKIQKEINDKTKELISFVDSNDMIYPKSLDEKRADGLKTEIAELEQILFTAEGSGVRRTKIRLEEKKSELKHIEKDIMNDIFYVAQISKEMNSPKVCNQIYDRLSPFAVSYGTEKIVNDCIDYKLKDFPGSSKQHKTDNFLFSMGYYDISCYFLSEGMSESEYNKILLYWLKDVDKKDIDQKNYSELGEVKCYTPPSEIELFVKNLFDGKQIVDCNREFLYTVNREKEKFFENIEETVDGYQDAFMSVDMSSIARKMGITDEAFLKAIDTAYERSVTIGGGFAQGMSKAACNVVSSTLTLPSTVITMPFARVDAYMELLDEHSISKPNLFEFMLYDKIADLKFFGDMAISSATGIWNEVDEKIINGTTEERAEVGGEVFFNAILAALAWEWASGKKNAKVSNENLADDINPLEKPESNVVDDIVDKVDDVSKCADGVVESGKSTLAQYGDDFGKMGIYVENPNIKVDWTQYAGHAAERMQQRGITQEMVNNVIKNGKVLSQNNGNKFAYITQEGVAIVSKEGKLITAWSSADFDSSMLEIISELFGK